MSRLWFERTAASRAASAPAPIPSVRSSASSSPPAQQTLPTHLLEQRCCAGDAVSNRRVVRVGSGAVIRAGWGGWVGVGAARLATWATTACARSGMSRRCDAGGHALRHVGRTVGASQWHLVFHQLALQRSGPVLHRRRRPWVSAVVGGWGGKTERNPCRR